MKSFFKKYPNAKIFKVGDKQFLFEGKAKEHARLTGQTVEIVDSKTKK